MRFTRRGPDHRRGVRWLYGFVVRRVLFILLTFAMVAAACSLPLTEAQQQPDSSTTTIEGEGPTPPTTRAPRPTPTLPPLDPDDAEVLAQLPGQLAIGAGPIVAIANPDGSAGRIVGGGDGTIATQPTWSNEGTLVAWSEVTPNASAITVYDPASDGSLSSPIDGPPAFYLQWNGSDQMIAYLRNDPNGDGVEAGAVRPGEELVVYDRGSPHFFAWAPERDFWVSHVDDARLALVSVEEVIDLEDPTGTFSTPQWIDDDRFVYASPTGLAVFDLSGETQQSFAVAPGPLNFTLSPLGTHIAYLEPDAEGQLGALRTVEIATGTVVTVTDLPVVMWEWSPDGNRLVWTGLDRADAANLAQLHVWSIESEAEISVTPAFRPSQLFIESYMPFFPQYSVSHTSWAPDSSAFVFAGSILGDLGIWVHAIADDESGGVEAARVAVGDVAFWSPNDAQAGEAAPAPF